MARITLIFSVLLILIGCIGYVGSGFASVTALIPAGWGIALGITGFIALNEKARMHAMHVAVLLGLIGAVASGGMVIRKLSAGDVSLLKLSVLMQLSMAVTCIIFVALCVNSFIQARRNRKADSSEDEPA